MQEIDPRTGKPARAWPLPGPLAAPVYITPDGTATAATAGWPHPPGIHLWRPADGKATTTFDRDEPILPGDGLALNHSVHALSPDGRFFAFTHKTGFALDVIDLETKKRRAPAQLGVPAAPGKPARIVTALAFAPDGKRLAVGLSDGTVQFWNPATGREEFRADLGVRGGSALAFTATGKLIVGGADTTVTVWDVPALAKAAGK